MHLFVISYWSKFISSLPIGIFDSGVGGLSVLKAIREIMPNENLIYLADSLHTPYGEKSAGFIEQRVHHIADYLLSLEVKAIVIACNTATAAGVHSLRKNLDLPIIGLEPALKPATEFSSREKVGVLATQATLDSEKYLTLKQRFLPRVDIIEKASHLFVNLVETAPQIGKAEMALIAEELNPFVEAKVDALVLGCTHYPFLTEAIKEIVGEEVTLFESALPVAKEVQRRIEGQRNQSDVKGKVSYYSSAPDKAKGKFESLLGEKIDLLKFE
ncbi:glutamate racemase [Aliikangiella sp. G2MR2-5]|uniref:glutamate racemase n=1 Tax=Aliikangiella sp. G2MR2-5 TaxID=2788943 RepID=UPI0018AC5B13|nr:glutamate racemase [Aliikangiella sp. G2MR2-5]